MALDIAKVDTNRQLDPGLPAWNFRDGVLHWLLHGNSLLLRRTLLIPFVFTDALAAMWTRSGLNAS